MTKKKTPLHIPTHYFVDENIETSGDGLSPETAFKTMNEAFRAVYVPDGHDVIIVMPEKKEPECANFAAKRTGAS